jgi:acyl-CoA thioesterase-1
MPAMGEWMVLASPFRALVGAIGLFAAMLSPALAADGPCRRADLLLSPSPTPRLAARISAGRPVRILAIGSSSTQGVGASANSQSYPARLEGALGMAWPVPVTVRNAGIGGEVATLTVERLRRELAASTYDVVLWQIGTNDAIRGEDERTFVDTVETGMAIATEAGADLMLVDQQYYPGIRNEARYEHFVDIIAETARKRKVPVFSRYKLMKDWAGRDPGGWRALLSGDSFHMNDAGYDCLASGIAANLERLAAAPRPVAGVGR